MGSNLPSIALVFALATPSTAFAGQSEFIDLGSLAQFPGATFSSEAYGVSADGLTVVGTSVTAGGVVGFGPNGQITSDVPVDISGDGSVVAFDGFTPRIWTAAGGIQDFRALLTAGGATPPQFGFEIPFE